MITEKEKELAMMYLAKKIRKEGDVYKATVSEREAKAEEGANIAFTEGLALVQYYSRPFYAVQDQIIFSILESTYTIEGNNEKTKEQIFIFNPEAGKRIMENRTKTDCSAH